MDVQCILKPNTQNVKFAKFHFQLVLKYKECKYFIFRQHEIIEIEKPT